MKSFIQRYRIALIAAVVAVVVLTIAFMMGGNPQQEPVVKASAPQRSGSYTTSETVTQEATSIATEAVTQPATNKESKRSKTTATTAPSRAGSAVSAVETKPANKTGSSNSAVKQQSSKVKRTINDKYKTEPVPQGKPEPVEPQEQTTASQKAYVTLSISCSSVLQKLNKLDEDKREVVPVDGWILKPTKVEINDGESVFDVTKRVCIDKKIHFEFAFTPIYNSAYIEGIGNLYEFDCGSGSGWMYKIDDWFPNYGCSRYVLKGGETVKWLYTTNIGQDIGGGYGQWSED